MVQNRLLEIAHSRVSRSLVQKYGRQYQEAMAVTVKDTDDDHIFRTYETMREQPLSVSYIVNTHIAACSCDKGKTGAPCSHQVAVVLKRKKHANTLLPVYQKELRRLFAKVALGDDHMRDLGFYSNIHEKSIHQNSVSYQEGVMYHY
jgi:hypothetical protein